MLPGWLGSDYVPSEVQPDVMENREQKMTVLDWNARIFHFKAFLSPAEADHVREISEPRMERSGVVASEEDERKNSKTEVSDIRTSYGVFLERGEDDVIKRIEERIAKWSLLPVENGEGLQVLRYNNGQKYDAHWDYFFHKDGVSNGGNRFATVLMYLTDVEEGGETAFPLIPAPGGENPGFTECARYHLAARPRKGDAILFHSIQPSGALERKSMHTACPVVKGTKWSAAKWIHVGRYAVGGEKPVAIDQTLNPVPKTHLPGGCEDLHELCEVWAADGECTKNNVFMVGDKTRPGSCLVSCKRCDLVSGKPQPESAHQATASRTEAAQNSKKKRLFRL